MLALGRALMSEPRLLDSRRAEPRPRAAGRARHPDDRSRAARRRRLDPARRAERARRARDLGPRLRPRDRRDRACRRVGCARRRSARAGHVPRRRTGDDYRERGRARPRARCRRCSPTPPSATAIGRSLRIAGAAWRHADAARVAAAAGAALRAFGIAAADRVALMCGNRAECVSVWLGCGWIGAVAVPINTASMGPQIEYVLRDSGARLLVIEDAFLDRMRHVALAATSLVAVAVIGAGATAPAASPVAIERWPAPGLDGAECAAAAIRPGDPLAILYTSGTTGPAKGVIVPARAVHGVGAQQRTRPRRRRRRRARHDAAALPHQRPEHDRAGARERRRGGVRGALLGVALLAAGRRSARDRRLPARRDGADAARAAREHGRARAPRPHRPRPRRSGRRRRARSRRAPAFACSRATARPRPTSSSPPTAPRRPTERWAASSLALRRASSTSTTPSCCPASPASWSLRASEPCVVRDRLFRQARADRAGVAQRLVPHRRPRRPRGRRAPALRRPAEGRDPPPRREHLVVRGRAGAARAPRRRRGGGVSGALRARRGRGDGGARLTLRPRARPGRAVRASASSDCRSSRSRATSTSSPTCRAPRTARCRSSSCASAASRRQRGTARPRRLLPGAPRSTRLL